MACFCVCSLFFLVFLLAVMRGGESASLASPKVDPSKVSFVPNYQGCLGPPATDFRYCNTSLSIEERVASLLSDLTLEEKILLIGPDPLFDACPIMITPLARLGIPGYMFLDETNTGVASACYDGTQACASTFIGPGGLGATFNRSLWYAKGDVISTELRAFSNANWYRGIGSKPFGAYKIGFDGYGPNINIIRDPRFGRNSELPSEDPYLSGSYAQYYVNGIQQVDEKGYLKMAAYLKHYTAYSTETNRGHDTYNISLYDFWDTYLPQFEMGLLAELGNAGGVMCSYDAENGNPSCANDYLLNTVIREMWNRSDALVTTDCGVLSNLMGPPVNAPTRAAASAYALNNGTDLEAGDYFWTTGSLLEAIAEGLTTTDRVDAALTRSMTQLFKAGRFDPPDEVAWTQIDMSVVNSSAHNAVLYEAAVQSFVLLKNEQNVLPLTPGSHIAVLGPQGIAQFGLLSDYYGDEVCYSPQQTPENKYWGCIATIAGAIGHNNVGGVTTSAAGVDIDSTNSSGIPAALALAQAADVVVLVLGIDNTVEHEGIDRVNITLPGLQEPFAQQVLALGKPTVLVLVNGGALAIDTLVAGPQAIVEAFKPSVTGAAALGDTLFGLQNRWGKMPFTIYPADYVTEQSMTNYNMSAPPGRTYKYYTGTPLWPFGFGLSYTNFSLDCALASSNSSGYLFTCDLENIGKMSGDEIIQVYHVAGADIRSTVDHPVPIKSLIQFERLTVGTSASLPVSFYIPQTSLTLVDNAGQRVLYPGTHYVVFSRGNGSDVSITITI